MVKIGFGDWVEEKGGRIALVLEQIPSYYIDDTDIFILKSIGSKVSHVTEGSLLTKITDPNKLRILSLLYGSGQCD